MELVASCKRDNTGPVATVLILAFSRLLDWLNVHDTSSVDGALRTSKADL